MNNDKLINKLRYVREVVSLVSSDMFYSTNSRVYEATLCGVQDDLEKIEIELEKRYFKGDAKLRKERD